MQSPVLAALRRGDSVSSIWLVTGSVAVAELCARARPDAIVFDLQHGLWDPVSLFAGIGLVREYATPMVRLANDSYTAIGTALDAGAMGIIVPLVETAEQAAAIVTAAKYPLAGKRSAGGIRPVLDRLDYMGNANQHIMVSVMIETVAGVENAAAIAATPGIDMVYIGPGDLAHAMGTFPGAGPNHEAAIKKVQADCRQAKCPAGIMCFDIASAVERRRQGFQFVSIASDQDLYAHASGAVKRFSEAGEA